ncbi:hypothetical protein THRCLA_23099 [Thraustotheca clavata]|uniref:Uncharacterized protein n=1 Tax=Thraustotheca clavata TaxID=74557 RepID=A0A1V9YE85_9STRA|nr:hypothetical protein THRCLA_23099 [Thraustotheca clavata]
MHHRNGYKLHLKYSDEIVKLRTEAIHHTMVTQAMTKEPARVSTYLTRKALQYRNRYKQIQINKVINIIYNTNSVAVVSILIAVAGGLWLWRRSSLRQSNIPFIPYCIPFLGSSIAFSNDSVDFLNTCQKKYGSVFQLLLAGKYIRSLHHQNITIQF